MRSTISAFVIVMDGGSSGPRCEGEATRQAVEHRGVEGVDLLVGQGPVGGAIRDRVGEALLVRRDRRTAVAVEEANGLDLRIVQGPDLLDDLAGAEPLVDDHGDVAGDGGEPR